MLTSVSLTLRAVYPPPVPSEHAIPLTALQSGRVAGVTAPQVHPAGHGEKVTISSTDNTAVPSIGAPAQEGSVLLEATTKSPCHAPARMAHVGAQVPQSPAQVEHVSPPLQEPSPQRAAQVPQSLAQDEHVSDAPHVPSPQNGTTQAPQSLGQLVHVSAPLQVPSPHNVGRPPSVEGQPRHGPKNPPVAHVWAPLPPPGHAQADTAPGVQPARGLVSLHPATRATTVATPTTRAAILAFMDQSPVRRPRVADAVIVCVLS